MRLMEHETQEERGEPEIHRRHDAGEADLVLHRVDADEGEACEVQGYEKQKSFKHVFSSSVVETNVFESSFTKLNRKQEKQKTSEYNLKILFCQESVF